MRFDEPPGLSGGHAEFIQYLVANVPIASVYEPRLFLAEHRRVDVVSVLFYRVSNDTFANAEVPRDGCLALESLATVPDRLA